MKNRKVGGLRNGACFTYMVCVHFNNYCLTVEHVIYDIVIDIIGHSLQTFITTCQYLKMLMPTTS